MNNTIELDGQIIVLNVNTDDYLTLEHEGFEVKSILDSVSAEGRRLNTITCRYPRFIHSEIMTHQDRVRNAASSRAIPFPVMLANICNDPVIPIKFGLEQSGMQTGNGVPDVLKNLAEEIWLKARDDAAKHASQLHNIGDTYQKLTGDTSYSNIKIHKSIPNRIVEPWMWITVVMTATQWKNYFRLRCHGDAEIHFQKIAKMTELLLNISQPVERLYHCPFIRDDETFDIETGKRVSTARVARVSYLTHEGVRDYKKDLDLFDKLVNGSGFGHWSPHSHVATAIGRDERSGSFIGWRQFRKEFANECADN